MKLSELIAQLQTVLAEQGDMPVQTWQGYDSSAVEIQPDGVGVVTNLKLAFDGTSEKVLDIE